MPGVVNGGHAGRSGRVAALTGLDPDLTREVCQVGATSSGGHVEGSP